MLPPPDASRREGNTSYWPEAKVWAKKAWLIEAIGSDAVRFAEANGTLEKAYKRQRGRWHDARRKIMVRALLSSPPLSSPLLSPPLLSSPLLSSFLSSSLLSSLLSLQRRSLSSLSATPLNP